jgi:hypothetical protein
MSNKLKRFSNMKCAVVIFAPVYLLLSSCGAQDKAKSCVVTFGAISWTADIADRREGEFRGEMSQECQDIVAQSGNVTVSLHSEAPANAEAYWADLKAGERTYVLGAQLGAFTNRTVDTYFSTSSVATWTLPWKDKPQTMRLVLKAPLSFKDSGLPTTVTVSLAN